VFVDWRPEDPPDHILKPGTKRRSNGQILEMLKKRGDWDPKKDIAGPHAANPVTNKVQFVSWMQHAEASKAGKIKRRESPPPPPPPSLGWLRLGGGSAVYGLRPTSPRRGRFSHWRRDPRADTRGTTITQARLNPGMKVVAGTTAAKGKFLAHPSAKLGRPANAIHNHKFEVQARRPLPSPCRLAHGACVPLCIKRGAGAPACVVNLPSLACVVNLPSPSLSTVTPVVPPDARCGCRADGNAHILGLPEGAGPPGSPAHEVRPGAQ